MAIVNADLDQQLEELLAESIEAAQQRQASTFDELTGGNATKLVLFGAGNLGRRTLTGLRKIGIEPVCIIDNNKSLWGQTLDGLPVHSPAEGAALYRDSRYVRYYHLARRRYRPDARAHGAVTQPRLQEYCSFSPVVLEVLRYISAALFAGPSAPRSSAGR